MGIIKLALIELRKKVFFSILSFVVCLVAFYLIISSITAVSSTVYQKKVLLANIGMDLADVIHLIKAMMKIVNISGSLMNSKCLCRKWPISKLFVNLMLQGCTLKN